MSIRDPNPPDDVSLAPLEALEAIGAAPDRAPASRLPRALLALRQRNFRLYWLGQLVSIMGTAMQSIGLAWLVLQLTHNAFQIGLVGAIQRLPVLLLSLFAGVLVDRWPKRRVVFITQALYLIASLLLWALVATGAVQLWHLYALSLVLGLVASLDAPARLGFVVELAGRDDLPNAVALNATLVNVGRIVGPAVGGVLIAAFGVPVLFLLNAVSFVAVLLALALMDPRRFYGQAAQPAAGAQRQGAWESLREGLRAIVDTPTVALAIVVVGLALLFGANFGVVLPLFATDVLRVGATGYGLLGAALGTGSLLASIWLTWKSRTPTIRRVLWGALAFGIVELAFALSPWYTVSLALLLGVGFAEELYLTVGVTAVQLGTPDALQGRVMSVLVIFLDGSVVPGYLLTGWLSSIYGAPIAVLIGAVLCLLVVAGGWAWRAAVGARAA